MTEPKSLWAQHIEDSCPEGPFPPEDSCRHPKWQRVEPGTVIPAGQPYRVEYTRSDQFGMIAQEGTFKTDDKRSTRGTSNDWFVDSSWRPPLELPTEPTWGIPIERVPLPSGQVMIHHVARWQIDPDNPTRLGQLRVEDVLDFIPLTDEQVARIEAAR